MEYRILVRLPGLVREFPQLQEFMTVNGDRRGMQSNFHDFFSKAVSWVGVTLNIHFHSMSVLKLYGAIPLRPTSLHCRHKDKYILSSLNTVCYSKLFFNKILHFLTVHNVMILGK